LSSSALLFSSSSFLVLVVLRLDPRTQKKLDGRIKSDHDN